MTPSTGATAPGDRLRDRLGREAVLMPGVWDPLSARLAANAGFGTVFVSGYCVAGTALGVPDVGLLTQTEMADVAARICRALPDIEVVVDGDTGYGNALNVARTVDLWEAAGAAGIFIEDQVWPKRCGHLAGKHVVPREEWLAKLEAALARRDRLHVTARTDARAPLGLDEAVERGRLAAALGVDAVFVEAPESIAELEQIAAGIQGPVLVANMVEHGRTPLLSLDVLDRLGFRLVVSPLSGLFRMVRALEEAFVDLRHDGSMQGHLHELVDFDAFTDLVGLPGWLGLDPGSG